MTGLWSGRAGTCGPPNALNNPNAAGCCNKDGSKPGDDPAQAIGKLLGVEGPVHVHYHLSPAPKEKSESTETSEDASASTTPPKKTSEEKKAEKEKIDKKVIKAVGKATKGKPKK